MATQTNWHLDALGLPDGDPMAEIAELKSEARVIDLLRSRDVVMTDLTASLEREAKFSHYAGLECDIKFGHRRPPCYECPHYTTDTSTDARGLICQLGRHQVNLLDELDAIKAVEALDAALVESYKREVAACEEMAAALL